MSCGAKTDTKNDNAETPADTARRGEHGKVLSYLQKYSDMGQNNTFLHDYFTDKMNFIRITSTYLWKILLTQWYDYMLHTEKILNSHIIIDIINVLSCLFTDPISTKQ